MTVGAPHAAMPHPASAWASLAQPAPALRPLEGDTTADVVVIGAGFTGLNAAWELSKRGADAIVLEANDAGWGASGRNGGMAVLRYKKFWAALAGEFGDEATLAMYRWIHEGLDTLEANVRELGIECGFRRCGHITAAHGERSARALEDDIRWLAVHARDSAPRMLGRTGARDLMGTDEYVDGYLDPRAAGVHPLDYSRGFAAALVAKGVRIHRDTPALEIVAEAGRVIVRTPRGEIRARQALVCTNAYTWLFPLGYDLARRMVSISAAVIATAPVPEEARRHILPQGHIVTDTRHLVNYFRVLPGGGVLYGGRGSLTGREAPRYYENLVRGVRRTFPSLREVPIAHRWCGRVGITMDGFPHIGAVGDRVFYALGYYGRGVVLTNLLGKHLARRALGEKLSLGPMSESSFRPIPFNGLRIPVMKTVAAYYKLRDRLAI